MPRKGPVTKDLLPGAEDIGTGRGNQRLQFLVNGPHKISAAFDFIINFLGKNLKTYF